MSGVGSGVGSGIGSGVGSVAEMTVGSIETAEALSSVEAEGEVLPQAERKNAISRINTEKAKMFFVLNKAIPFLEKFCYPILYNYYEKVKSSEEYNPGVMLPAKITTKKSKPPLTGILETNTTFL